jgi:glycyl-tRNA synthetase beta chain
MSNGELLLELLSEEIPARMQRAGLDQLKQRVKDFLGNEYLEPKELRGYVTPRRLAVIATGIPDKQADFNEERRGPKVGAPETARAGFARSAGIAIEDLIERDGYCFAEITRIGRPARDVLPKAITEAIEETVWPKSMRFPAASLHWVRPLNSIICLFDGEIVPLSVGQVPVGRTTRGHRFLSEGEIAVDNAAGYLDKLERAYVVLDHGHRRDMIAADLDRLAKAEGLNVKSDPGLLDEVAGLVEFPVVLMGAIDEASMELPPEVLATAMRTHQKYFSCLKPDGSPAPRFLLVANNLTADDGKTIVAGNERVLRARLADARFFWDQDRKIRLEDRVAALKDRVYYEKLGTVYDKTKRMEQLSGFLAEQLYSGVTPAEAGGQGNRSDLAALDSRFRGKDREELARLARRAAYLAKADLSTGMVGEFPELQGVMGRYYAIREDEDPRVAGAIAEHYRPLGPNDACPTAPVSVVVALADKFDTLVGFYGIGETPTGSRDPYALRRAALGVARLIVYNNLRLSLQKIFEISYRNYPTGLLSLSNGLVSFNVLTFIVDRLKIHLRSQGVRPDFIAATVYREALDHDDDLVRILARVDALAKFLETEDGVDLLIAYRRASNIVEIEEKRESRAYNDPVDTELFRQPEEKKLYQRLNGMSSTLGSLHTHEQFGRLMERLATLRGPVDEFFEKVTVNADDPALRENRLRLLSQIRAVMNQVADFSQIEG